MAFADDTLIKKRPIAAWMRNKANRSLESNASSDVDVRVLNHEQKVMKMHFNPIKEPVPVRKQAPQTLELKFVRKNNCTKIVELNHWLWLLALILFAMKW